MQIINLEDISPESWDIFAENNRDYSIYSTTSWKRIVDTTFNYKSVYKAFVIEKKIVGIFGFYITPYYNKNLVSVPFCPYGCFHYSNDIVKQIQLKYLEAFIKKNNLRYAFLKSSFNLKLNSQCNKKNSVFYFDMSNTQESHFPKLNKKLRWSVSKSEKENTFKLDDSVENFYKCYSKSMLRLGSPVEPLKFFLNIKKILGINVHFSSAYVGNEISAVGMFILDKKYIRYERGANNFNLRNYESTTFLVWNIAKHYNGRDFHYVDLGKSEKGTGSYKFKRKWSSSTDLYYYFVSNQGSIPNFGMSNYKRMIFAKLWRNLPISLANKIGPLIRKFLTS